MASTPTFTPNPYANFDPSQWSNPYSQFYGQALPWPSSYAGTPTNALGQPIQPPQPPQGLTLNSTPQQPQAPAAAPASNPFANVQIPQGQNDAAYQPRGGLSIAQWQALTPQQRSAASVPLGQVAAGVAATPSDSFVASHNNPSGGSPGAGAMFQGLGATGFNQMQQQQPQAPGAAAGAPNAWQNTLSMLANPGHVTTPGATVPQAQSPTGVQPGVLQSFLANWQPAQSGPGSGFTQNFNALLRGLPATKGS
jgi:hypothetical protein